MIGGELSAPEGAGRFSLVIVAMVAAGAAAVLVGVGCAEDASRSARPMRRHALVERLPDGAVRAVRLEPHEIGGETRPALSLPPGEARRLAAPVSGVLRFAVALEPSAEEEPAAGARALALALARDGETIDETRIPVGPARRWHAVDLAWDLRPEDTLSLRADGDVPLVVGNPRVETPWTGPVPPMIVLILIDTLRADHTSLHAYERETTPHLDALATEGTTFLRAYAPAPWTRPSVSTFFTGLSPERHRTLDRFDRLSGDVVTWAEMAEDLGYTTVGVVTNPNVLATWGFAQGFSRYIDVDARGWLERGSDARRVGDLAAEIIESTPEPLFLYLHILDPHDPYDPPVGAARKLFPDYADTEPGERIPDDVTATSLSPVLRRYDGEIRNADDAVGEIVEELRRRGVYESAAIVVVSDHGEEFADHGGYYHGTTLYEEQLRVPMVIKLPAGAGAGETIEEVASIGDALPSLADVLGWSVPDHLEGRRWFSEADPGDGSAPRWLTASLAMDRHHGYALIGNRHKLIYWLAPKPGVEVYDLVADPSETTPLKDPPLEAQLKAHLDSLLLTTRAGWHVRLCGGTKTIDVRFRLSGLEGPAEGIDLEGRDRVMKRARGVGVRLRAGPHPQLRESEGRQVQVVTRDVDELVFSGREPHIEGLRSTGPLRVTVGDVEVADSEILRLEEEKARRPASDSPICKGRDTVLYVWFVEEAAETVAPDDATRDRLRALGYLQDDGAADPEGVGAP